MKSVTIKELFSAMFLFEIGNTGVILYTNTSRASTDGLYVHVLLQIIVPLIE